MWILWAQTPKLQAPQKEPIQWVEFDRGHTQFMKPQTKTKALTQNKLRVSNSKKKEISNRFNTKKYGITSGLQKLVLKGTKPRAEFEKDFDSDFNGTYPELEQANNIDIKKLVKLSPSLEAIRGKIQRHLDYPDDFLKERIKGNSQIILKLNKDGTIKQILSFRGDRDILCAYVMSITSLALKSPLRKSLHFTEDFVLSLKFNHNYDSVTPTTRDQSQIMKNLIAFKLHRFVEPRLNQELKHVFTHYVPPIVPIPGGFFVDLYHLHKFIKNWGKPSEKQQRAQRLAHLKKLLEESIKSNESP